MNKKQLNKYIKMFDFSQKATVAIFVFFLFFFIIYSVSVYGKATATELNNELIFIIILFVNICVFSILMISNFILRHFVIFGIEPKKKKK